jgi:hypothetical protein
LCSTNPARIASCTRRHLLILAQARYLSHDNYRRPEMSIYFPVQKCIPDWRPSNGWMPRTLKRVRAKGSSDHASASAGLSDAQIKKWYIKLIEEHILTTICRELHAEYGTLLPADYRPQMSELELAWVLHSATSPPRKDPDPGRADGGADAPRDHRPDGVSCASRQSWLSHSRLG